MSTLPEHNFHPTGANGTASGGMMSKEHYHGWWPSPTSSQMQQTSAPPTITTSGNHSTFNPMFFNPSQSSLSVAAAVASILPSSTQSRKSRRCRCPMCLGGNQPASGNWNSNEMINLGQYETLLNFFPLSCLITVPGEKKKKRQHICHIPGCGKVRVILYYWYKIIKFSWEGLNT